ncbi:glycosyltransferase family 2 protein [Vagococcus lutrae]|uniref:glycosyltransferase family 2 protein n=1 Tax=Vagococcus lutrae TaxID=81947 RepID=UPI00209836AE|nr:glycosyltransferase family 2 protein [Vagococcus lutrae]MCO7150876.1 glycosyltransferase [Vagococcus lutrae]
MNQYKEKFVSIIMPAYNSEKTIERALNSVVDQSYSYFELIIINDNSVDNTLEIISRYTDDRIKILTNSMNYGAAKSRNKGIEIASGQYIAFLDADDEWEVNKLEKQIMFMQENLYFFTFTGYKMIDGNGKEKMIDVPPKINYKGLLKNTIIACSTVIIDRNEIGNYYMPNVRRGQDTLTWLNILKNIPYAYGLNCKLTTYHKTKNSISSNKFIALQRTFHNYYKEENLGLLRSVFYFIFYIFNAIRKHM